MLTPPSTRLGSATAAPLLEPAGDAGHRRPPRGGVLPLRPHRRARRGGRTASPTFQARRGCPRRGDPAALSRGARRGPGPRAGRRSPFDRAARRPRARRSGSSASPGRAAGAAGLLPRARRLLRSRRDLRRERRRLSRQRRAASPSSARAAVEALPRLAPVPHAAARARLARRAGAGLPADRARAATPSTTASATVLSVHNAGYQGHFPPEVVPDARAALGACSTGGSWSGTGSSTSSRAGWSSPTSSTTVSPDPRARAAHPGRRLRPAGGLHAGWVTGFIGDPQRDRPAGLGSRDRPAPDRRPVLARRSRGQGGVQGARCSARSACRSDPRVPLFGMAARLVDPEGARSHPRRARARSPATRSSSSSAAGEPRFEQALHGPGRRRRRTGSRVNTDFTDELEHQLMAGADFLLMPCQYEPCGLTQMRAQRYGALPVVRRVGGLADTVEDGVTGFVFDDYTPRRWSGRRRSARSTPTSDPSKWQRHDAARRWRATSAGSARSSAISTCTGGRWRARRVRERPAWMDFVLTLHSHLP